ncbi:MAG: hypothetical protein WCK05_13735 [Planctomycetota bacterium]
MKRTRVGLLSLTGLMLTLACDSASGYRASYGSDEVSGEGHQVF